MIVEEFVHVVFDETNLVQQDQRPKFADEEDMLQENQIAVKRNLLQEISQLKRNG